LRISEYKNVNKNDEIDIELNKKKKDIGHDYEDNKEENYN
jgi:hypothetical protein